MRTDIFGQDIFFDLFEITFTLLFNNYSSFFSPLNLLFGICVAANLRIPKMLHSRQKTALKQKMKNDAAKV